MPRKSKEEKISFFVIFISHPSKHKYGITVYEQDKAAALENAYKTYEQMSGRSREEMQATIEIHPRH
jgi:hypothetical protein